MTTPTYTVPHRREREGRTDYEQRLQLLKSRKKRFVIRLTNTQVIIQVASYDPEGDIIHLTVDGHSLDNYDWDHGKKSIPAAYLTGAIAAQRCADEGIDEGILDVGLQSPEKGGRLYAAVKGLTDHDIDVPAGDVYPSQNRINGEHINETVADDFQDTYEDITG
jgi:large subunit ribosomal protein L18